MTSFEDVKMIDQVEKHTINGYLRMLHEMIASDEEHDIPPLIIHWCLLFYHIPEKFAGFDAYYGEIGDDGRYAKNVSSINFYATIYGHKIVQFDGKQIHEWKVRCSKVSVQWGIGIEVGNVEYENYWTESKDGYTYLSGGEIINCRAMLSDRTTSGWSTGDVITLKFNEISNNLSISINDKIEMKSSLKVKDTEHGYKLVLYFCSTDDSAELLSYGCKFDSNQ